MAGMMILDRDNFSKALKKEGFDSLGALCAELRVHRNSLSRYLSGTGVLPKVLEAALSRLKLEPQNAFRRVEQVKEDKLDDIRSVVGEIVKAVPDRAIMLFGSRTKNTAKKYSDYDLGLLGKAPMTLQQLSKVKDVADEAIENLPFFVDVVDLNRADSSFIDSIKHDAVFMGGNPCYMIK